MLSYTVPEPRKSQENSRVRKPPQQPRAKVHELRLYDQTKCLYKKKTCSTKTRQTAATFPFNPSPLSEAEGEDAAVLPLTWMPVCARGCRTRLPGDFSRDVLLCGTSHLFLRPSVLISGSILPSIASTPGSPHERRWHTPRTGGNMTRPNRERRSVAPSREAAKECSPRRKPWEA